MKPQKAPDYYQQNRLLKLFKILSNANRLKIIKYLAQNKNNSIIVSDIVRATGISENNISNHLKLMRISKVLSARQDGHNMYYSIKDQLVKELISSLLK